MYSEECAKCTKTTTCKLKDKKPDMFSEDGCPVLLAESLKTQGETVVMVSLSDN